MTPINPLTLSKDVPALKRAQTSVVKSLSTGAAKLQAVLMASLMHAQEHNDPCLVERLWLMLTPERKAGRDFIRAKAFKAYVEDHSPIRLPIKDDETANLKGKSDWALDAAAETTFWAYTEEQPVKRFVPADILNAPFAALQRAMKLREDNLLIGADGEPLTTAAYETLKDQLQAMCNVAGSPEEQAEARKAGNEARELAERRAAA